MSADLPLPRVSACSLLVAAALVGLTLGSSRAHASPITDPTSVHEPIGSPLFDEAGLPFLLTWSPAYFGIPVDGEPGGDGDGPGGGNPFSFSSFDLPLGPGDLGNPGIPGGPGNLGDSGDLGDGRTDTPLAPLFDNPLAGPPANLSTEELPKVEDVDQGSQQRAAPEPAALLLIGAGLSAAAAIRRRSR